MKSTVQKKSALLLSYALVSLFCTYHPCKAQTTITFMAPADTMRTWIVPADVDSVVADVVGGTGGLYIENTTNISEGFAGHAARVIATIAVTPGQVLYINIGGKGNRGGIAGAGGYNGGGHGGADSYGTAGGGGGASDIRIGGTALSNRILIAAGGGGSSHDAAHPADDVGGGGGGADASGQNGSYGSLPATNAGGGGSQTAGGAGGQAIGYTAGSAGALGIGGSAGISPGVPSGGGGGGGGYYGGGAGSHAGGGGGSSYASATATRDPFFYGTTNYSLGFVSLTYTSSVAVHNTVDAITSISVVPNPSNSQAALMLDIRQGAPVRVSITDAVGRTVWTYCDVLPGGRSQISLPDNNLAPGIYQISVTADKIACNKSIRWQKI